MNNKPETWIHIGDAAARVLSRLSITQPQNRNGNRMLTDLEELDPTQRRIVEALWNMEWDRGDGDATSVDDLMERCRIRNRSAFREALEELEELCWLQFHPPYAADLVDSDHVKLFSDEDRRSLKKDVEWINQGPENADEPEQAPVIRRDEPFEMPF